VEPEFIVEGPARAAITLVLAHGAGAPMDSPFMDTIAHGLASDGFRIIRFEFPYMRERRETGRRRAPDREPVLLEAWRGAIASAGGGSHLVIGGKSLGGRIASMVADEQQVRGLVCLGYPFHPPGKPPGARVKHLATLNTPTLIMQGTRDTFGSSSEVEKYKLSAHIRLAWIEDGDHSFKPRARSGRTEADNLGATITAVRDFLGRLR
jgi:uncharacterized protein